MKYCKWIIVGLLFGIATTLIDIRNVLDQRDWPECDHLRARIEKLEGRR